MGQLKKSPDSAYADIVAILERSEDQAFRPWGENEEKLFLEGLELYGKNYDKLAEHLGTGRTPKQIQNHFYSLR